MSYSFDLTNLPDFYANECNIYIYIHVCELQLFFHLWGVMYWGW